MVLLLCSWLYCRWPMARGRPRETNLSPWFRGDLKVRWRWCIHTNVISRATKQESAPNRRRNRFDEIKPAGWLAGCCMPSHVRWLILLRGITVGSENRWILKNWSSMNSVISSIFNCEFRWIEIIGRGFFQRSLDRKELYIYMYRLDNYSEKKSLFQLIIEDIIAKRKRCTLRNEWYSIRARMVLMKPSGNLSCPSNSIIQGAESSNSTSRTRWLWREGALNFSVSKLELLFFSMFN